MLDLVEPLIGPDIAVWSSHFICKPKGNGKRVSWHKDSAYWKGSLAPMEVVTVWLAIDPSTTANGCMHVVPRTQDDGYSEYVPVNRATNVFDREITPSMMRDKRAVRVAAQPGQAARRQADLRQPAQYQQHPALRLHYALYACPCPVRPGESGRAASIYLAGGRDRVGNTYADPGKAYPELARYRELSGKKLH